MAVAAVTRTRSCPRTMPVYPLRGRVWTSWFVPWSCTSTWVGYGSEGRGRRRADLEGKKERREDEKSGWSRGPLDVFPDSDALVVDRDPEGVQGEEELTPAHDRHTGRGRVRKEVNHGPTPHIHQLVLLLRREG